MLPGFAAMHPLRTLARPRRPIHLSAEGSQGRRVSPSSVVDEAQEQFYESEWEEEANVGHAVDVLRLLDHSWFGSGPKARPQPRSRPRSIPSSPHLRPASDAAPLPPGDHKPAAAHLPSPLVVYATAGQPVPGAVAAAAAEAAPSGGGGTNSVLSPHSAPIPASLPKPLPPEALAVQQLPGIGTWAGRQRLFARPVDLRGIPSSPSTGGERSPAPLEPLLSPPAEDDTVAVLLRPGRGNSPPRAHTPEAAGLLSSRSSLRSDQAREEAWRWRFSRKWEAEQKKYYDEANASVLSNDDLDALRYTQACGIGVNLQFNPTTPLHRTNSRQSDGTLQHSLSCQFDVSGHGSSLALGALAAAAAQDQQRQQARQPRGAPWLSPAGEAQQPSATSAVLSMVDKARDLLQKQKQIEQAVQSRWESSICSGNDEAWAGQRLPPVQISMSGRFRYVVLRVVDGKGHQRYLVRGRPRCSPAELAEEAAQEAAAICKREGLPQLVVEPVGMGVMEWREDTDRHLHLSAASSSGDSISGGGAAGGGAFSPKKGPALIDATGLAASLVRQALPCHFQISTTTAPSRMASLMDTLHI